MRLWPTALVWAALMAMLALEVMVACRWPGSPIVPLIGPAMAVLVAVTFMRLGTERGLARVFALAGVFWLAVLIGLGSLDALTRHDIFLPK